MVASPISHKYSNDDSHKIPDTSNYIDIKFPCAWMFNYYSHTHTSTVLPHFFMDLNIFGIVGKPRIRRVAWSKGTEIWKSFEISRRKFLYLLVIIFCCRSFYSLPMVTDNIAIDGIGLYQLKPFIFLYSHVCCILHCSISFKVWQLCTRIPPSSHLAWSQCTLGCDEWF